MRFPCRVEIWGPLLLAALFFTTFAGAEDSLTALRQRGLLRWGADAEGGGPFVFPRDDDPSRYQGFEVEIAELLAAKLGVKADFRQGQWDKLPELLERGDLDIVLNGYEWKPQYADRFGVTLPYYVYQLQLLTRTDDARLQRWDDLKSTANGRWKIAVLGGSAAEDYLRSHFADSVELVLFDGSTDAMRSVELGIDGLDGTLQDLPIVTFYHERFPKLRRLGEPVSPGFYVILAKREEKELIAALNDALLACQRDGSIPRVLRKYGLWNSVQQQRGLLLDANGNFQPDLAPEENAAESEPHASRGSTLLRRIPRLLLGAAITIFLSVTSMPIAVALGLTIAVGRLYGPRWLSYPLSWYVEIIRGTPLVLQLYVIFFLLPEFGPSLPPLAAAIIGLAMNYSAYEAEIYRAGLLAVPRGQMEAALSLGMTRSLALRTVIIPQAVRIVIPPVMNDFIALFKDTAVCSVITVVELSKQYYIQAQSVGAVVELGIVTALFYFAMSYPLTILSGRLERRLAAEQHG